MASSKWDLKNTSLIGDQPRRLGTIPSENTWRPSQSLHLDGLPTGTAIRHLCLEDLPLDILHLILEQFLNPMALRWESAHVVTWPVDNLKEGPGNLVPQKSLCSLARTSRSLHRLAIPYLYRAINIAGSQSLMGLWVTLCQRQPLHATYIRHLYVELKVNGSTVRTISHMSASAPIDRRAAPKRSMPLAQRLQHEPWASIQWADGQPLLAEDFSPGAISTLQRMFFDIVRRSEQLQSFNVMPPMHTDTNATFIFRQALAALTSPSLLRPIQHLHHLRAITIHTESNCRHYLSKYGILVMPVLEHLMIVNPTTCWSVKLRVIPEGIRKTTILQKAHTLCITHGRRSTGLSNSNLRFGLENLPNLQSLAIHPNRSFSVGRSPVPLIIIQQMEQHGRALHSLDISWIICRLSGPVWPPLDTSGHLTCWAALQSLVSLTVSTQVLFGSLRRLQDRLRPPSDVQDSHKPKPKLVSFLQNLPPALQLLTLTEHWRDDELGIHDKTTRDRLMTWHGQGDWMEARLADEMIVTGASDTTNLRAAIRASHETAIMELVGALCSVWLGARPTMRALVIQPQQPAWYELVAHPVVIAEADGLLRRRVDGVKTLAIRYAFVEKVWLRGVGGCC